MSTTIAVHVRYKFLYVSLSSSVKQQREMIKFFVFWRRRTMPSNFSYFNLEFNAGITRLAWVSSETSALNKSIQLRNSKIKYKLFLLVILPGVAVVIASSWFSLAHKHTAYIQTEKSLRDNVESYYGNGGFYAGLLEWTLRCFSVVEENRRSKMFIISAVCWKFP